MLSNKPVSINEISNRTIFRILLGITLFVGLIFLALVLRPQLVLIGTALFLAIALDPIVERIARYLPKRHRGLAAGVVLLLVVALLAFVVVSLIPPLVNQTQSLIDDFPQKINELRHSDNFLARFISESNILPDGANLDRAQLADRILGFGTSFADVARTALGSLVSILTVLVLTFFMIMEGPVWLKTYWRLTPARQRQHQQELAGQMYRVISGWVTGRLMMGTLAAIVASIAMTIVGVPYAVPLALLVGLLDLMPLVGASLGAVLVSFVALFKSFTAAVIMAIFFVIYQQLENTFIQPMIDSRTVQISPLTVLISAILGISLGGILGALVAIPAAGCAQILAKDYLKNHPRE